MITLLIFFTLLFAGLPIFGAILVGAIVFMASSDLAVLYDSIPIQFYGALEINGLLAIPLFLLVGEIMNKAGLTQRLIAVAQWLVGGFRGGLAYANLVTNALAAAILGSAVAQIGVMTKVMLPEMEKRGYDRAFSGAVTVSAGLLGPIIPPSMLMIIYGIVAVQPIAALFIAGILPGLLIIAALALVIFLTGVFGRNGLPPGTSREAGNSMAILLGGLAPAAIPVIVISGIMAGAMTPTESGAVASIVALALGFAYRQLRWRDLGPILHSVALGTATITGLIAAASVLSWVLAFQGIPDQLVALMAGIADTPFEFLLLVIALLLLLGMFLETMSTLIVVVPLLMPVVAKLGIDPIHFGVVCTVASVIGLVTPPVGPGLFIAMQADIRMGALFRATAPFLVAVIASLVLIAAWPALSTWLPSLTIGR